MKRERGSKKERKERKRRKKVKKRREYNLEIQLVNIPAEPIPIL